MNQILFMIGDWPVHAGDALIGFGGLVLILLLAIVIVVARSGRHGAEFASLQAMRADEFEERLNDMLRAQSEANGRVDAMAQALAGRQAEMARAVNERLDSVTHRVGQSMEQTTRNTMDSLRVLHERLGDLDRSEPDAGRVVHGLEHVVDQLPDLRRDLVDRFGHEPEPPVRQDDDFLEGHAAI